MPSYSPLISFLLPSFFFFFVSISSTFAVAGAESTSTEYTADTTFRNSVLSVTNTYRKQHNATSLSWNETLAEFAGQTGEGCLFEHSGGPYGENLASGYPNVSAAIVGWGHERVDYDFRKGEFGHETGHFTQLVWKNTTQVGCSRKECNGGQKGGKGDAPGWYLVCEYSPAGNVIGAFVDNVQEKVPKDEQPDGPSDPSVPEDEGEECMLGADCSGASGLERSMAALWVAVLVSCVGVSWA